LLLVDAAVLTAEKWRYSNEYALGPHVFSCWWSWKRTVSQLAVIYNTTVLLVNGDTM